MIRPLFLTYKILLEPRSSDDNVRRREFILNVLLVGSLALATAALGIVISNRLMSGYAGESPMLAFGAVALFGGLYWLSRAGHMLISAFTLVLLYLVLAMYSLSMWGIVLPEGLLILSLSVVMASVLLGTRYGLIVTAINGFLLIGLAALQDGKILKFDSAWASTPGNVSDAVEFALTLAVIATVSWLSNREIERSLSRAKRSETDLKRERDSLETKVQERTNALELAQREKVMELTRFADFGRLTSTIVHELVTPLTTVALNLEKMHDEVESDRLKRAIESTKRMERYVESARKQLQNQSVDIEFSPIKEVDSVLDFLAPEAVKSQVLIEIVKSGDPTLYGNPIKFHQLATNLIANAINAYTPTSKPMRHTVAVELKQEDNFLKLSVQDWGAGIPTEKIEKIFDPFFSLKTPDQGMGIGLSICKEIVEQDFKGAIEVESNSKLGTIFTARIPIKINAGK